MTTTTSLPEDQSATTAEATAEGAVQMGQGDIERMLSLHSGQPRKPVCAGPDYHMEYVCLDTGEKYDTDHWVWRKSSGTWENTGIPRQLYKYISGGPMYERQYRKLIRCGFLPHLLALVADLPRPKNGKKVVQPAKYVATALARRNLLGTLRTYDYSWYAGAFKMVSGWSPPKEDHSLTSVNDQNWGFLGENEDLEKPYEDAPDASARQGNGQNIHGHATGHVTGNATGDSRVMDSIPPEPQGACAAGDSSPLDGNAENIHDIEIPVELLPSSLGLGTPQADADRFWGSVNRMAGDQCWTWAGATDRDGYGVFKQGGKTHRAHVWSADLSEGNPGPGYDRHHMCGNEDCVRFDPRHVITVTKEQHRQFHPGRIRPGHVAWINGRSVTRAEHDAFFAEMRAAEQRAR